MVGRGVNHCLLEAEVLEAPQIRYTKDNQTPVAEMSVRIEGLRPDDPPGQLKVVGWGNLAQDLQNRVQVGQRLVLEGSMRMNTVTRQDGVKEKRAELTLSRLHPLIPGAAPMSGASAGPSAESGMSGPQRRSAPAPRAMDQASVSRTGGAVASGVPAAAGAPAAPPAPSAPVWNTGPLIPEESLDDDDIPF